MSFLLPLRGALIAALLAASPLAHAQWDPGATQMLGEGMGFSALGANTLSNGLDATKDDDGNAPPSKEKPSSRSSKSTNKEPVLRTQADVDAYMNERMQYHARALAPEYKRRAKRDGTAAADQWIRARAEELGRMEGEKARGLVRRD